MIVAASLVACAGDPRDGVELPGVDGAPSDVVVPEPPSLPTSTATPPPATSEPTEPAAAGDGVGSSTTVAASESDVSEASSTTLAPTTSVAPSTTDAPTTTEAPVADVFLRVGDEGPEVRSMQEQLIALEYLPAGAADGRFDQETADALIDFQADYGLVVDGIYGPESDRALNAAAASVDDQ